VSFDESRLRIPHRFLDWYEEQELWTPYAFPGIQGYPGAPARAISTFTAYCSLSVVMVSLSRHQVVDHRAESSPKYMRRNRFLVVRLVGWPSCQRALMTGKGSYQLRLGLILSITLHLSLHPMCCHCSKCKESLTSGLTNSMVYHTLVILLHRPFVETAASPDTSVVTTCWSRCEEAAKNTTALLKRYRGAFSLARAPYLIVRRSIQSQHNRLTSVIRNLCGGYNSRQDSCSAHSAFGGESATAGLHRGARRELGYKSRGHEDVSIYIRSHVETRSQ